MTTNIIIQIVIAIIACGAIAGIIKMQGKQRIIGVVVLIVTIVASLLLWLVH